MGNNLHQMHSAPVSGNETMGSGALGGGMTPTGGCMPQTGVGGMPPSGAAPPESLSM